MAINSFRHNIPPETALSKNTKIRNGTHILYVSAEFEKYIDNALSFLTAGIELNQGILFIDSNKVRSIVVAKLQIQGITKSQLESILFVDNEDFYEPSRPLNPDRMFRKFSETIGPLLKTGKPIRHWGKVIWLDGQVNLLEKLTKYEGCAQQFIKKVNSFGICAFDGMKLPATVQMEIMKFNQYIMSDNEFVVSSFYDKENLHPSIRKEMIYETAISSLRIAQSHYARIIEEMPDAVFITSRGNIAYTNKSALKLMKANTENLQHKVVWDIIDPAYHEEIKQKAANVLNKDRFSTCEVKLIAMTGKKVDVEVLSFPFVFEDKETIIHIARNIKERKENHELMIRNEKLEIAGQLAASIAHEIRNPLTAIKGFMKLAEQGSLNIKDVYPILDAEINRIETISSELLLLGKPVSTEIKVMDLSKLLYDICTFMQSQANMENVMLHFEIMDKPLFCRCNGDQVKQVFMNIIKNAIEAVPHGGKIMVYAKEADGHALFEIIDNGVGIPEDIQDRLGEPFYTTKEKGTGLGLMVCYNIIEQHNGHIRFHSAKGVGTTFTVSIPLDS
ncbi:MULTISPECIES: ATP-binding protein [Bacillaceae]|uniref:ATP-binding protein n=1 Tax=Bacillaceae TaxID=186817 RepID=UPI001E44AC60|nr:MULTISPECIES: ATP-binding protein [Bacillaceae]MCE4047463.1 ATP-binding protein [Bacillus sp. Au-Bac7]MDL0435843.1 ATP-binding protein [Niallia sp. SS-2023]UPO86187.1 ATP-binding protein [Niallia sp. Man26]